MKEQNGNEQHERKKKKRMNKEQRFYLITGIASAAALAAIVLVAVLVTSLGGANVPTAGNPSSSSTAPDSSSGKEDQGDVPDPDEPVVTTPEGMQMPLSTVSILHEYGFYHNSTLNNYYEHTGIDFTAEVGAQVLAVDDGVVESVYSGDVLTGTEITIDHGDGVKTVYRFVDAVEGLKAGASVKKGDAIATVAEATGEEYKDGPHLHFEVLKSGASVDPAAYLTFEEK